MSKRNPIERIIIVDDADKREMYYDTEKAKNAIYDIVTNNEHVEFVSGEVDGTLTITII